MIYQNEDFLVLNKPAGMLVLSDNSKFKSQKSKLGWPTLTSWLIERYPEIKKVGDNPEERPGIVHRLDKDTSGVMVVARNQRTFEYLKNLFQEHQVQKKYLALVYGEPKEKTGVINQPISLKPGTTRRTIFGGKMEKEAVTEYEFIEGFRLKVVGFRKKRESFIDVSLLEVKPKTGRTHQIRVHLASIGNKIVNDPIYASKKEKIGNGRLMLHAKVLEFTAEDGRRMRFEAEPPEDFGEIIEELESRK